MASVGHINSTKYQLYKGANAIGYLTDVQFERSVETIEVTTKGSAGNAEFIAGKAAFSYNASLIFREDATYGYNDLMTDMNAKTAITIKATTSVTGDSYEEGSIIITSLSRGGGVESTFDASVSFQGTGALTIDVEV